MVGRKGNYEEAREPPGADIRKWSNMSTSSFAMPLTIPVILGTVRSERIGPRVAKYLVRALEQRQHKQVLIDPVEFPLPLLDKMYKEYKPGSAPEVLEKLAQIIK